MLKQLTICAALLAAAMPAHAAIYTFTGTRENINPLLPPGSGRCAPTYFNTVLIAPGALTSTGMSNLGDFTSTQSHCIVTAPPTDIVDGIFRYDFLAGDSLSGVYSGTVAFKSPGVFDTVENLVITGGTGRFTDASGTIVVAGTLVFGAVNGAPAGFYTGTVNGTIEAVPEPASWAMMIGGLGLVGGLLRARPRPAQAIAFA